MFFFAQLLTYCSYIFKGFKERNLESEVKYKFQVTILRRDRESFGLKEGDILIF